MNAMLKKTLTLGIGILGWAGGYTAVAQFQEYNAMQKASSQLDGLLAVPVESREAAATKLLAQDASQANSRAALKRSAAGFLIGWRIRNIEAYSTVCHKHGVELSAWSAKIAQATSGEYAAANKVVTAADIAKMRDFLLQRIVVDAEKEIQSMATQQGWPMGDACNALNIIAGEPEAWKEMWPEVSPYKFGPKQMAALMEAN